jgi:hypothetical protein
MKSSVFWYMTPYSSLKVDGNFGATCRLLLQGRKVRQETNVEAGGNQSSGFLFGLFFGPENGGDIFLWNVG